jgi:hypothetical protein
MKKIVKDVKSEGGFNSQWGYFYKFIITFEDGMIAESLSTSELLNKFRIGKEIDVEVTQREYNGKTINKVKPVSNFQGTQRQAPKSGNRDELIVKQNALTNACNVIGEADVVKIIEVAEVFSNWVLKGEKPTSTTKNDLPF